VYENEFAIRDNEEPTRKGADFSPFLPARSASNAAFVHMVYAFACGYRERQNR
jgi:hypothetical protein